MKWFDPNMSEDELKQRWKTLARKYHPDICKDPDAEETFKEISNEYTDALKRQFDVDVRPLFDEQGEQDKIVQGLRQVKSVLDDVYPRTKIDYIAWVLFGFLEFGQTPIRKVCHCLQIACKFMDASKVYATFTIKSRKKKVEVRYDPGRKMFFIDAKPDKFEVYAAATRTYNGNRYQVFTNKEWQRLIDTKEDVSYFIKRSPKLKAEELFGL